MIATTKTVLALGFLAAPFLLVTTAKANELSGIQSIRYAGTGCPIGSLSGRITAQRDGVDFGFSGMRAEVGPQIPLRDGRKNCQVLIDLRVPNGWSYAIKRVLLKGDYDLDPGVRAEHKISTYFQGEAASATFTRTFSGPAYEEYELDQVIADAGLVWSPCGVSRPLNINTAVRVIDQDRLGGFGAIAVSPDQVPLGNIQLAFKRCS